YYYASTTNQQVGIQLSSATGYTAATINTGEMVNEGIESDLKFTPVLKTRNGLRWDFSVNFTYNNNYVKSIGLGLNEAPIAGTNSYVMLGKAFPQIKVTDWQRDSATGRIIINKANGYPTPDNS